MESQIDLLAIFVTDIVGVAIITIILATRGWNLPARQKESRALFLMLLATAANCMTDALIAYCDGRPGGIYHVMSMAGNTYTYLYNLIVGIGIIFLVVNHIDKKIVRFQMLFFAVLTIVELVLLAINFVYPVVFSVDENNVYSSGKFFYVFVLAALLLLIYGYAYYFVSKIKNPSLRYFPVFEFLLPILAGMTIQVMVYGISLIPISFVIAFAGIVIALQNECIYIDKLTGVYNRYELDKVLGSLKRKRHEKIAAMMLDLNGFKEINDKYSHEEGDQALIAFAGILVAIVRGRGTVIRFAGDEFVVLMRKVDGVDIEACRNQILHAVEDYNAGSGKPYKLSAAVGGTIFDYNGQNANEIVERIDRLMYKDKDEYYRNHPRHR
ncbi:MAG: GGDEF domain-containing protein [Clostridiales bacterium]|nr:GGDEF domain-containing protein [Clostridiales bacterium]